MLITLETVRTALLAAQGLLSPPKQPVAKTDIFPLNREMGYLQIDAIQADHRSRNLVLWSRLGDYKVDWLDELHTEDKLFENYAHALCYLPILHGGRLVERLDPKAHRKESRMEIRKIYLEPGVAISDALVSDLRNTLEDFMAWHGLGTMEIGDSNPVELREALV